MTVHVNRTLQQLRRQQLITLEGGTLTIQNLDKLMEVSLFNPDYLHLDYSSDQAHGSEREAR